jgi:hypothetical protein
VIRELLPNAVREHAARPKDTLCRPGPQLSGRAAAERIVRPARIRLNTKSARGSVGATPVSTVLAILKLIGLIVPARLTRQYDDNPFFDPVSGGPIKQPRVLSEAEASALKSAV